MAMVMVTKEQLADADYGVTALIGQLESDVEEHGTSGDVGMAMIVQGEVDALKAALGIIRQYGNDNFPPDEGHPQP